MAETQIADGQEVAEAQDVLPNEPRWLFDGSIPEPERTRLRDDVVSALKTVFDPEIPCDIYELGLIYKVDVGEDRQIKIDMTLTAPGCPVAGELTRSIETSVGGVPGVLGVDVAVVFDPPWDQGRMSDEARVSLDMF
ncbi:SUF system Fe-S cluster assembly protein [Beijerinckiaceae bacterium]|nr:SUF system Fe-S cluster assembly protein [Beijerinckiaceae bacterium]